MYKVICNKPIYFDRIRAETFIAEKYNALDVIERFGLWIESINGEVPIVKHMNEQLEKMSQEELEDFCKNNYFIEYSDDEAEVELPYVLFDALDVNKIGFFVKKTDDGVCVAATREALNYSDGSFRIEGVIQIEGTLRSLFIKTWDDCFEINSDGVTSQLLGDLGTGSTDEPKSTASGHPGSYFATMVATERFIKDLLQIEKETLGKNPADLLTSDLDFENYGKRLTSIFMGTREILDKADEGDPSLMPARICGLAAIRLSFMMAGLQLKTEGQPGTSWSEQNDLLYEYRHLMNLLEKSWNNKNKLNENDIQVLNEMVDKTTAQLKGDLNKNVAVISFKPYFFSGIIAMATCNLLFMQESKSRGYSDLTWDNFGFLGAAFFTMPPFLITVAMCRFAFDHREGLSWHFLSCYLGVIVALFVNQFALGI
jgi:hypothetical protein